MLSRDTLLKNKPLIISGPCSISSREQITAIAYSVKNSGAHALRAQLWKPRTLPDSFQGVGIEGIPWLLEIKQKLNIPLVMEVMSEEHVELISDLADVMWVGARNMQNYSLLKKLANVEHPIILKRGLISNIKEWVGAAEYIGKDRVIMCERGIRTGADSMRFTLDLNSALVVKHDYGLPVIIDPSHTAGRRDMVPWLAKAGIAIGADGIVVEAHTNPEEELVDKDQTITIETLKELVRDILHINSIYNLHTDTSDLHSLRERIDNVDLKIISLLSQRSALVKAVATYKHKERIGVVDMQRWTEASATRERLASNMDLDENLVHEIYETIHRNSIKVQEVLISSKEKTNE